MKIALLTLLVLIGGCTTMNPTAVIETNAGTMELELFKDKAPVTVDNFVKLANEGYYDGVIFHRVIYNFMIQGGDPTGTGRGDPGYTIQDEFHPALRHDSIGILSMANKGTPNSGGGQFFITLVPTPWLDDKHSVFGKLISGEEVLKKIGSMPVDEANRPLEDVVIEKVTIK